jgi:hypothetical protein
VRVSRAPLDKLLAYKKRLGWTAEWVSSRARGRGGKIASSDALAEIIGAPD